MGLSLDEFIDMTKEIDMLGVLVLQHGKEVARHEWVKKGRVPLYSVTKSFTAAAIGMAVEEGLLELDVPVKPWLKEVWPSEGEVNDVTSARLDKLTLRHLITMTLGHERAYLMGEERWNMDNKEWAAFSLRQPMVYEPGEIFVYNNAGPYLAGVVLQEATGMSMLDYLMPRLFEPLGMSKPSWETDGQGRNFGSSGLDLTLDEMAKVGQLYLQKGVWEGNRFLSEKWIEATRTDQIKDPSRKYGLGFWLGPKDLYRADGKFSQHIIVAPEKEAVIAVTANNTSDKGLIPLIYKSIYKNL